MNAKLWVLIPLLTLFACAHQSVVDVSPAYNIASSYSEKIPGVWALYIDVDDLEGKDLHMKGFECGFHRFPIAAGSAFVQSSLRTIKNIVHEVNLVERPMSGSDLGSQGYAGQIILKGEELDGDLVVITDFWSNKIEAEVDMAVSVRVEGIHGRLLGTTVSGDDESIHDAGVFCGGGAKAVAEAGAGALKKIMQSIAESISNSPRVREYASGEMPRTTNLQAAISTDTSQGKETLGELLGYMAVERIAKSRNCGSPTLLKNEYKIEIYDLRCPNGDDLIVKCDWGTCALID